MLGVPVWRIDLVEVCMLALPIERQLTPDLLSVVQMGRGRTMITGYMGEEEHAPQSTTDSTRGYIGAFRIGQDADLRLRIGAGLGLAIYHVGPERGVAQLPDPAPADCDSDWVISGAIEGPVGRHRFVVLEDRAEVLANIVIDPDGPTLPLAPTTRVGIWEYDVQED
jgi:hypothetical protein